jgi:LysM repeat protein
MRLTSIAAILFVPLVLTANDLTPTAQTSSDKPSSQSIEPPKTQTAQAPTPPAEPIEQPETIVQVATGDTLIKIANRHQTTYTRIFNASPNIKHPDLIHPGDQVRIPKPDEQLAERHLPSTVPPPSTAPPSSNTAEPQSISPPKPKPVYTAVSSGSVWDRMAQCESGGNWSISTGNGYYGGLQFTLSTWRSVGGSGYPHQASPEEQIARASILQARSGWGQWPACAARLGLL